MNTIETDAERAERAKQWKAEQVAKFRVRHAEIAVRAKERKRVRAVARLEISLSPVVKIKATKCKAVQSED